jgi:anti-anti-sigma factor
MEELYKIEKHGSAVIMGLAVTTVLMDDNDILKDGFISLLDEGNKNIVVDLAKTEYISSLVLASFVFMFKKAKDAGGNLVFCNINNKIMEILKATSLDKVFELAKDRDDAIARLSGK